MKGRRPRPIRKVWHDLLDLTKMGYLGYDMKQWHSNVSRATIQMILQIYFLLFFLYRSQPSEIVWEEKGLWLNIMKNFTLCEAFSQWNLLSQ